MAFAGDRRALSARTVRRTVHHVLKVERVTGSFAVTFLSTGRMRALNRKSFGRDRATDVIAFSMQHDGELIGDVFVCPAMARHAAHEHGISDREEMLRLVIHGVLHVLGYDHPTTAERTGSDMWRRQERYVEQVLTG